MKRFRAALDQHRWEKARERKMKMAAMRRNLLNFVAAGSLIVFVAMVWVIGFAGAQEHSMSVGTSPRYSIGFNNHAIMLTRDAVVPDEAVNAQLNLLGSLKFSANRKDYVLGGQTRWTRSYGPLFLAVGDQKLIHEPGHDNWFAYSLPFGPWWQFSVSCRLFLALSLVLPVMWAIRLRRQWGRMVRGECGTCGYSLNGNTSGICPECGTPFAPMPVSSAVAHK